MLKSPNVFEACFHYICLNKSYATFILLLKVGGLHWTDIWADCTCFYVIRGAAIHLWSELDLFSTPRVSYSLGARVDEKNELRTVGHIFLSNLAYLAHFNLLSNFNLNHYIFIFAFKVHVFWEGHKILRNLHLNCVCM